MARRAIGQFIKIHFIGRQRCENHVPLFWTTFQCLSGSSPKIVFVTTLEMIGSHFPIYHKISIIFCPIRIALQPVCKGDLDLLIMNIIQYPRGTEDKCTYLLPSRNPHITQLLIMPPWRNQDMSIRERHDIQESKYMLRRQNQMSCPIGFGFGQA